MPCSLKLFCRANRQEVITQAKQMQTQAPKTQFIKEEKKTIECSCMHGRMSAAGHVPSERLWAMLRPARSA